MLFFALLDLTFDTVMTNSVAILGIHTGIGKTIASAVLAEALGADYWKPVQAGIEERDSTLLRSLLTDSWHRVHDEEFLLSLPMSPHAAARIDNVVVDHTKFAWPQTDNILLVETAGGLYSPISDTATMVDFVAHYQLPAILVVQHYLGSINHTLLSMASLRGRGIKLLGLVICGHGDESSEQFIEQYGAEPIIARIPHFETIDRETITAYANEIKDQLKDNLKYRIAWPL